MAELHAEIDALLTGSVSDLARIERTLTDGYAHALTIEAENWRLEKQIAEVTHGIDRGDAAALVRELSTLTRRRDGNADALTRLRARLADLRRHLDGVRSR